MPKIFAAAVDIWESVTQNPGMTGVTVALVSLIGYFLRDSARKDRRVDTNADKTLAAAERVAEKVSQEKKEAEERHRIELARKEEEHRLELAEVKEEHERYRAWAIERISRLETLLYGRRITPDPIDEEPPEASQIG